MKKVPCCWSDLAVMIGNTYGTRLVLEVEAGDWDFMCPECGEPILETDWKFKDVKYCCPICQYEWEF